VIEFGVSMKNAASQISYSTTNGYTKRTKI